MTYSKFFKPTFCAAAILLAAGFNHTQTAAAYEVAPLHHYLELVGKNAMSSFAITNTHDYPLTVEMMIEKRIFKNSVHVEDVPADDDFLIFPPQAIIAPGKVQRVQVRYVGESMDESEFFRLIVRQVPVELDSAESNQVNLSYNFNSAVYVAPKGAKSKLVAGAITPSAGGSFDVVVTNEGQYHALLPSLVWTASNGSQKKVLDSSSVPLGETNFVEPGGVRTINIPAEALDGMRSITALDFSPNKSKRSG